LAKISSAGFRFPAPVERVQVNFCKNVRCPAFGVPETLHRVKRAPGAPSEPGDYTRAGKSGYLMRCGVCKADMPIRSNQGVVEEVSRMAAYLRQAPQPSCPAEECENFGVPVAVEGRYARFGKASSGARRWRCGSCRKTFTEQGGPLTRQRKTHKNRDVFVLLVNKSPLRRIMEITELSADAVYGKIAFIHRQCLAFVAHRERELLHKLLPSMYVAVDRQAHTVNWSTREDRRNIVLNAIGSADLGSGYVFGFHLNFDAALEPAFIEHEAKVVGDPALPEAYRRFARLWLSHDYAKAVVAAAGRRTGTKGPPPRDPVERNIQATYDAAADREDVEASEQKTAEMALPLHGMQVREQYTMHGHFHLLKGLLRGAEKLRVYMDQDSGMRAAFMGAFVDRIKARTADGWFVSVLKESTIHQKEGAVQKAKLRLADAAARFPGMPEGRLMIELMKEEMARAKPIGQYGDKWLVHPVPNMSEPAKRVCWLTDFGGYDADYLARLHLKGSLHAIDRFFMQTRRLLSMAERSLSTASKSGRVWYGYAAYNPENLIKTLEIFRVYYNYCKVGEDKKTPAMRLGLAKAPIKPEDILYFHASAPVAAAQP
jgi:transposase-like protein